MDGRHCPLFHIGYHKTATTWFQKSVWPHAVSHRYVPRSVARLALLEPAGLRFDANRARDLLEQAGDGRPIVVSEENLSGYIHTAGLHGLMAPEAARRIKSCYPDARILIGIRNQYDVLNSCYAQYVAGGGTLCRDRYLFGDQNRQRAMRHQFKNPGFSLEHFEYDQLIAYYEELFGRMNVHIVVYEALRADANPVLDGIENDLGVVLDRAAINYRHRNISPGATALNVSRILNLFRRGWVADKYLIFDVPDSNRLYSRLMRIMASGNVSGRGSPAFSDAQRCMIDATYAQGNTAIARRYGLDLAAHGYPTVS